MPKHFIPARSAGKTLLVEAMAREHFIPARRESLAAEMMRLQRETIESAKRLGDFRIRPEDLEAHALQPLMEHFSRRAIDAHLAAKEAELQRRVDEEGCGAVIGALRPAIEEAIENLRGACTQEEPL